MGGAWCLASCVLDAAEHPYVLDAAEHPYTPVRPYSQNKFNRMRYYYYVQQ